MLYEGEKQHREISIYLSLQGGQGSLSSAPTSYPHPILKLSPLPSPTTRGTAIVDGTGGHGLAELGVLYTKWADNVSVVG